MTMSDFTAVVLALCAFVAATVATTPENKAIAVTLLVLAVVVGWWGKE